MKTTVIYTSRHDTVEVEGTPHVDLGTGALTVHSTGYDKVAHFERGFWAGYTFAQSPEKTPQQAARDSDNPF
ncbi:hypothetical protein pphageB21_28 [Pseudomonas phage pphageB21]|nr:hypothetical protein pphageB21_28 [Pseudomonas phage pphageB21]